jgi:hypothetical protein
LSDADAVVVDQPVWRALTLSTGVDLTLTWSGSPRSITREDRN